MPETGASIGYLSPNKLGLKNHLCVLPYGGLSEQDNVTWNTKELEPTVWYLLNGKRLDRMFGGFVFNVINCRPNHYLYPLYVGFGELPDKEDWIMWSEALFLQGQNFHALQTLAQYPLDVWVAVPYPHPFQENFGNVKGRNLNFQNDEDRFEAVKWWIDLFLERWEKEKQAFDKLLFRGFLWQKESVDESDEKLVKLSNTYIKAKNAYSLWLPNYGTYGIVNWNTLGFDITLVNPNYYGNTTYGIDWINNTSEFSKIYHTGMQIYFGKGIIYNDTHLLDYLNLGLPDKNGYMTKSFLAYQFPNQTVREIYEKRFFDYIRIYTFIKGTYTKVSYPGITY